MIRKQARQRRDFLYRKALQLTESARQEKREQLREALASGKPLDPSIAKDKELRKDYQYDEAGDVHGDPTMGLDDEYSVTSGVSDPRILVTTSRDPSSKLMSFSKEIRLLLPTSVRLNRGNTILPDLVRSCQSNGLSDMILLSEHRGTPTALTIGHLPHGPVASFSLHNVSLAHDLPKHGTISEAYPHLIFEGFKTQLGQRVVTILKHLFPPRPATSKSKPGNRVITFVNSQDTIEVRHHVFLRVAGGVELAEVGPRMSMRLFELRSGTLASEGDVEWHLSMYTRTGRKKDYL